LSNRGIDCVNFPIARLPDYPIPATAIPNPNITDGAVVCKVLTARTIPRHGIGNTGAL
jgi:hypothetical protein